jgi:AraC-like DNA-binding protein
MTGQTPHRYVLATRLRHAAQRLRNTTDRVIEIAGAAGFGDVSNFNAAFHIAFGITPTAFRARHAAARSQRL